MPFDLSGMLKREEIREAISLNTRKILIDQRSKYPIYHCTWPVRGLGAPLKKGKTMSEIAMVQVGNSRRLMIDSLAQFKEFAKMLWDSNLVDKKKVYENVEQVTIALIYGSEAGLTVTESISGVSIIDMKPAAYGEAIVGIIQSRPEFEYMRLTEEGDVLDGTYSAKLVAKRKDRDYEFTYTYSADDAKQAGLWPELVNNGLLVNYAREWQTGAYKKDANGNAVFKRNNWCKNPRDMVYYKLIARAKRRYFSGMGGSLDIVEDLEGMGDQEVILTHDGSVIDITPKEESLPPSTKDESGLFARIEEIESEGTPEEIIANLQALYSNEADGASIQFRNECADAIARAEAGLEEATNPEEAVDEAEVEEEATKPTNEEVAAPESNHLTDLKKLLENKTVVKHLSKKELDQFSGATESEAGVFLDTLKKMTRERKAETDKVKAANPGSARVFTMNQSPLKDSIKDLEYVKELLAEKLNA